jgi:hypothetical protein
MLRTAAASYRLLLVDVIVVVIERERCALQGRRDSRVGIVAGC